MAKKRKTNGAKAIAIEPEREYLPEGCHHYTSHNELPWDLQKYFAQRYRIFSRYDEGIWMTDDAWFGVTPEPVAEKIAHHLAQGTRAEKAILIDVFAGAGGNTIAFAKSGRWKHVYAIERNPQTLACAKHNAEIYGVQEQISWYEGDCFELIKKDLAALGEYAVVFASPPWGGPGYRSDDVFDLSQMYPYNLEALFEPLRQLTKDVVLYLPRTSDIRQLANCENDGRETVITHYCMQGASKALCAYFGEFEFPVNP